jgi:hypothetical protein
VSVSHIYQQGCVAMPQHRNFLRLLHILGGLYLGTFLFSPLIESALATTLARIVAIGLFFSGLAMWQWKRVAPMLRRTRDLK